MHIQFCSAACCVSYHSGDATDGLTCGLCCSPCDGCPPVCVVKSCVLVCLSVNAQTSLRSASWWNQFITSSHAGHSLHLRRKQRTENSRLKRFLSLCPCDASPAASPVNHQLRASIIMLLLWHGSHVFDCSSSSPLKPVFSFFCCVISFLFYPAMAEQTRPPLGW